VDGDRNDPEREDDPQKVRKLSVSRGAGQRPAPVGSPTVPIPYVTDHLAMARLSRATYGIPGLNGLISAAE